MSVPVYAAIHRRPAAPVSTALQLATSGFTTVVAQGNNVTRDVNLTRIGGYLGTVTPTCENVPTGVTASFSPTTSASGNTLFVLTLTAAADAPLITTGIVTVRVTGPGVSDATVYFALTVLSPVAYTMDGPANLPGPRWEALKAWANPIPDFAAIPSGRRVTVSGTNIQAALNAAAALTGGDRLVIVPDDVRVSPNLYHPENADKDHDVIIAWARVVNGTYAVVRGVRPTGVAPDHMPLLETATEGVDNVQGKVMTLHQNRNITRFKWYGFHIRVNENAPGNSSCVSLINFGDTQSGLPTDPTQIPSLFQLSHCIIGGRAFDSTGAWRSQNLGRGITCGASGFAMTDCFDIEHGDASGSDQGIYQGLWSQGPTWLYNVGTDFGGGIIFFGQGGIDIPDAFPGQADVMIEKCWFERKQKYNRWNTAQRVLDVNGVACPWPTKNMSETKGTHRICWRDCVFHWSLQRRASVSGGLESEPARRTWSH